MFSIPSLTGLATSELMQQTDLQQAWTIQTEIGAQAQREQWNRWQILQDTQTKIFQTQQEVTTNRARTQDKMYHKWDEYIRG